MEKGGGGGGGRRKTRKKCCTQRDLPGLCAEASRMNWAVGSSLPLTLPLSANLLHHYPQTEPWKVSQWNKTPRVSKGWNEMRSGKIKTNNSWPDNKENSEHTWNYGKSKNNFWPDNNEKNGEHTWNYVMMWNSLKMKHPIQHNPSFETIQKSSMWSLKKGWTLVRVSVTVKCEGFREAVVLGRSLTEGSPVLPVIYFRIFVILCACVCVGGVGGGGGEGTGWEQRWLCLCLSYAVMCAILHVFAYFFSANLVYIWTLSLFFICGTHIFLWRNKQFLDLTTTGRCVI